jgi:hypothetical protein
LARARAVAAPMPDEAPVITATGPVLCCLVTRGFLLALGGA